MESTIMLIDMDAFFASVEQQSNPALRGKPVAVTGGGTRTVVTTASYEARKFGVKTGMNIYEARSVCPELIIVKGDNSKYTHTCAVLKTLYLQFTPQVEIYSVDEAFLDITDSHHLFGGPMNVGKRIKEGIKRRFGINATVGIGPNKLIAKLAADISKPDGLRWIRKDEVPEVLEGLPVEKLWGIGKGIARRLETLDIRTCGELGRAPVGVLRSHFGIMGEHLKMMGQGIHAGDVTGDEGDGEVKSVGHSMTFPRDLWKRPEISRELLRLSEMVGARTRRYGLRGRVVSLTVRYRSFETFTRRRRLECSTNDTRRIYRAALCILDGIRLREPVRLLGVTLSGLENIRGQRPLFHEEQRREDLLRSMDDLNQRFGSLTVTWGACLNPLRHPGVISPAWRPSGIRRSI